MNGHHASLPQQQHQRPRVRQIDADAMSIYSVTVNGNVMCAEEEEKRIAFTYQTFIPFILAGCGMVAAGVLLERASGWSFLSEMPETTVLVLALLGLKGNLEMTLASRLSTMTNLGLMDSRKQQVAVWINNLSLVQAQAIVVSLVAAFLTTISYLLEGNEFNLSRIVVLTLTATVTASSASLFLTTLMVLLTIAARRLRINPDNILPPLAAATGDVTTLALMVLFGTLFSDIGERYSYVNELLLIIVLMSVPFWMWVASRSEITLQVLKFGWFAVLISMFISSGGGYILRHSSQMFPNISLFQPVINGAGGNLSAVQASKISTYLLRFGKMGKLPANQLRNYLNPIRTFACKEEESVHACILLLMTIPGHVIFISLFMFVQPSGGLEFDIWFFVLYFIIALFQVAILLYICQFLSRVIWMLKCNPDNNSIPLLTATGDLLGTVLLAFAFYVHFIMVGDNAHVNGASIQ